MTDKLRLVHISDKVDFPASGTNLFSRLRQVCAGPRSEKDHLTFVSFSQCRTLGEAVSEATIEGPNCAEPGQRPKEPQGRVLGWSKRRGLEGHGLEILNFGASKVPLISPLTTPLHSMAHQISCDISSHLYKAFNMVGKCSWISTNKQSRGRDIITLLIRLWANSCLKRCRDRCLARKSWHQTRAEKMSEAQFGDFRVWELDR